MTNWNSSTKLQFWQRKFLQNNLNYGKKLKFWEEIKFWLKISILAKKLKFPQKTKNLAKN